MKSQREKQFCLEEETRKAGIRKYRDIVKRLQDSELEGNTAHGKCLLKLTIDVLILALEKYKKEYKKKPLPHTPIPYKKLYTIENDVSCL